MSKKYNFFKSNDPKCFIWLISQEVQYKWHLVLRNPVLVLCTDTWKYLLDRRDALVLSSDHADGAVGAQCCIHLVSRGSAGQNFPLEHYWRFWVQHHHLFKSTFTDLLDLLAYMVFRRRGEETSNCRSFSASGFRRNAYEGCCCVVSANRWVTTTPECLTGWASVHFPPISGGKTSLCSPHIISTNPDPQHVPFTQNALQFQVQVS